MLEPRPLPTRRPRRGRGGLVARLPSRRLYRRLSRRRRLRGEAVLRSGARAFGHRRSRTLRRRRGRGGADVLGPERGRAHRHRHLCPGRLPPGPRRGRDDPLDPRRGSFTIRGRAHRLRWQGRRLHREAEARGGAFQPDQRRHLRSRAGGPGADPTGTASLHRAGDLPCPCGRRPAVRPGERGLLARHGTPDAYLRAHRDLLSGRRSGLRPRAPSVQTSAPASGASATPTSAGSVEPHCRGVEPRWLAAATRVRIGRGRRCQVEAGATVTDSVLLPGARVAARAHRGRLHRRPRRDGGRTVHGVRCLGHRRGGGDLSGTSLDGERYPSGN